MTTIISNIASPPHFSSLEKSLLFLLTSLCSLLMMVVSITCIRMDDISRCIESVRAV